MLIRKIFFLVAVVFFGLGVYSQVIPSYNMANMTVNDCRAKFYDDGGSSSNYTSVFPTGSSYTFNIVTGNPAITMTFNPSGSATQIQIGDFIEFHDGMPATAANLIAGPFTNIPVSGTLAPVTSTTGTLVVVFTEDGASGGFGWDGGWYSTAPAPIAPAASINAVPSCSSSVITLTTTEGVLCDSLKPNYFVISGPIFPVINTIVPVPCNNGTTNVIQINLAQPLTENCNYSINSTLFRVDACDSVYKYPNIISTFSIGTCPIQATLDVSPSNTVCAYSCSASVFAVVPASVCLNLSYNWNPPLPATPGPHNVCPTVTTVYNCTVTEMSTSNFTVITQTIYVADPQINDVATPTLLCRFSGSHSLSATPPGGVWSGPGIAGSASLTGMFNTNTSGPGIKKVYYSMGSCKDSIYIDVIQIYAGPPTAACLNSPSFTLTGQTPGGGTWSGSPHVDINGVFTPTTAGNFVLTYSVGNCSQTRQVNVASAVVVPTVVVDICKSVWFTRFYNTLGITPYGGRYSMVGPGITNNVLGQFSPSLAGVGQHVITYSLTGGCSDTFTVNVLDIDVSPRSATTCPSHAPFNASVAIPSGGAWSCTNSAASILNPSTGLYDPSVAGINSHTDVLVYTAPNGCTDTLFMEALVTTIDDDSLFFCTNTPSLQISQNFTNFGYSPSGGIYTGTGVSFSAGNYFFNPATAGPGVHTVYYDINTCTDSIKMVVYPSSISGYDTTICSSHPTMMVVSPPLPPGTTWSGPGIVTPSLGIFNPGAVLAGNAYTLNYTNKAGCGGSVVIDVYQFVPAGIANLNNVYCFRNNDYVFTTTPPNGTLTTTPVIPSNTINPSIIGQGTYTINYQFGYGACNTSTTRVITIHPELVTTKSITKDTVCIGEASLLSINASGGLPTVGQYTYTWSNGLINLSSHNVLPNTTTAYTVATDDGCSDPAIDTLLVNVAPQFYPSFATTSIQCYGEPGTATVNITPGGSTFSYTWNTSPVQSTSVVTGTAGKNYNVKIRNLTTGCAKDTFVRIPGYNAIQALFNPNPNLPCIPFDQSIVTFLDLSNGSLNGTWYVDGVSKPYTPGQSMNHEFMNPGTYPVRLLVTNDGNCPSEYSMDICIEESTEIFIPDIFSPNGDGANDVFYVRGNGIKEMNFYIYDRWGNKVFESHDANDGWKGDYKGKNAESGVYAYYLDATMFNDKKITKKGDLTLIR